MSVEPEELGQSGEELAALLKAVRKRSGLSGARAAARCNMSQSKVSRIENGKVRPSLVDVEQLLRACDAAPALVTQVMTLARLANTEWQGARGMRRKGLDKKQLELAGLEASSAEFRFFLLSMITGLLSTPEYDRPHGSRTTEHLHGLRRPHRHRRAVHGGHGLPRPSGRGKPP